MTTCQREARHMPEAGVRELKAQASEIVRRVRERKARYIITYRGRPVAVLLPLEGASTEEAAPAGGASAWQELERLGALIGKGWRAPVSSAELLSGMRR